MTLTSMSTAANWLAQLELYYEARDKTRLSHRRHYGPFLVQKAFYPEGDVCHTCLIHPPGGIAGGDRIELDVRVGQNAHALITTPAANKFYQSNGKVAALDQLFQVGEHASLEWLPQESIIFNGACIQSATEIHLHNTSKLFYWDMQCLGRTASGEVFDSGSIVQTVKIVRDQVLLQIEKNRIIADSLIPQALNAYQGKPISGVFIITPANEKIAAAITQLTDTESLFSCSLKNDVLLCRFLGRDIRQVQTLFRKTWSLVRPQVCGRPACFPRIWDT